MAVSIYILIITLNVTGLNAPTKDIDWLNGYKNKAHIYAVYKRPTSNIGAQNWKWNWNDKKLFHENHDISDKTDFKIKMIKRYKEGHYIIIKGSIQKEDITIVNICMYVFFFISISFTSALIFMISFLLPTWGFVCSSFCSCFRCKQLMLLLLLLSHFSPVWLCVTP